LSQFVTLSECTAPERARLVAQAEGIFFETSHQKDFGTAAARQVFLNRWFGHYADAQPQAFLLALNAQGEVTGYLAGCLDSFSAAANLIVADIDYFTPAFCQALTNYPSHFHINVAAVCRGQGIGHRLVERFADICARAGSPGMHVVTGAASRAVRFYEACGFRQVTPYDGASPGLAVLIRSTRAGA
jgi:GNAT superfamily N-acetyltransferase